MLAAGYGNLFALPGAHLPGSCPKLAGSWGSERRRWLLPPRLPAGHPGTCMLQWSGADSQLGAPAGAAAAQMVGKIRRPFPFNLNLITYQIWQM